ncbi:MAG: membrane protein [Clostridia bacterium]|nr:membrane protein [Clostridia bacterium]
MNEHVKRYLIFIAGVLLSALGIGFITRAALGTSPISSIPFVLSLITPPTMGVYTLLFNSLFLVCEVILRRKFTHIQALQIPFVVLFSLCIDGALWLIPTQLNGPYVYKVAYLLIGCAIMAFGIYLEVLANVVMLPGEALVRAISEKYALPFPKVKVTFDCVLTILAGIVALFAFHRLNGVREGTVVAALLVGRLVGFYGSKLTFLKQILPAPTPCAKPAE